MKNEYKKPIKLFISLMLIILLLSACSKLGRKQNGYDGSPMKFGATYMDMNNPFFHVVNDNIKKVVEANGDFLITRDPASNQEKQNEQIYDMIEEGIDAIFINPVDYKAVKPALVACKESGIPVFNVDTMVYDTEYVVSVIESNNYNAGVQCAEDMMKKLDKANIYILDAPEIFSVTLRVKGFTDAIKENENYKVIRRESAKGELDVAMEVTNNTLDRGLEFDVVLGGNDPTALGAIAAIEAHHILKDIIIYGVDGSPDGKMMIKEGYLEGSVAQSPSEIGTIAAEVADKYLNGEEVDKHIEVPVKLITKDNLSEFSVDDWW